MNKFCQPCIIAQPATLKKNLRKRVLRKHCVIFIKNAHLIKRKMINAKFFFLV